MGLIKEPKGVDFIIEGKPLTKQELEQLTQFINERKRVIKKKKQAKKSSASKSRESVPA